MSANSLAVGNEDMSDLCRVCLLLAEESQYLDLTTIYDEDDNLTYGECFTICTQIDLSAGEGVPHHLCKPCGLELQMAYDFHKKIEESNRIIEQCQREIKVEKANTTELPAKSNNSKEINIKEEETSAIHGVNEKCVITEVEEHLPALSDETEDCVMEDENDQGFEAPSYENEETEEIEIMHRICHTENNLLNQVQSQPHNSSLIEIVDENDEDPVEMEDYQNMEALDEATETETLQIQCGENILPVHVTNFKPVKSAEDFNEDKDATDELDKEYEHEITMDAIEEHLRWQENVVAVANKEHLPIEIETDVEDEEQEEEETIYITAKCTDSESQSFANESSQEEAIEDEEISVELCSNIKENNSNTNSNNSTGRKRHVGSYSCDYCQRVYPNYSRMKTHRRCHETDRPKFCCSHCGRVYATKQARDCHVQTAHDKSGYICNVCNKVFAIRKSLEIHIRYHTGDFPFACKLCDRKFAQACHLKTHINVKHNQIRFSCEYPNCEKYFTSSSALRNHEFTHGAMPFECEYCQQGYPAKSKLRIHIQRKHCLDISNDELENMRKFHVMRSKVNLVQFVDKL